jgi:hypothetical protein
VGKTEYVQKIMDWGGCYFMSRPRRFGKSLFLSTLMELSEGNRPLFVGTWIDDKWDWTRKYAVIHFTFAKMDYQEMGLVAGIKKQLLHHYRLHNIAPNSDSIKTLFDDLIVALAEKVGKVVVLIDEYDKPILDYIENKYEAQAEDNRDILKMFYSVLKDAEPYLHLTFITGITKFAKVSVFSDLNHINDITFDKKYATAYGYTQEEMEATFKDYLDLFLKNNPEYTLYTLLQKMRNRYNGYSWDGQTSVYNPFGLLLFLEEQRFVTKWYESGTPTFITKKMLLEDTLQFENIEKNINSLSFKSFESIDLVTLMLQSGYLTIKSLDVDNNAILGYPNQEVRESIYYYIMEDMGNTRSRDLPPVRNLAKAFENNDLKTAEKIVKHAFADLPYDVYRKRNAEQTEGFYHGIMHVLFNYIGLYTESEVHTTDGRADAVVHTTKRIFIFEFKYNQTATAALAQAQAKNYAAKYEGTGKEIVLIGANFKKRTRRLDDWVVAVV